MDADCAAGWMAKAAGKRRSATPPRLPDYVNTLTGEATWDRPITSAPASATPLPAPREEREEGVPPAETQPLRAGDVVLDVAPAAAWTVHVKTMMGAHWSLEVQPDESAELLRETLWAVSGTEPDQQKLVWPAESGDVILAHDDRTPRDYGIDDGGTLTLVAQQESVGRQGRAVAEEERAARRRAEEEERRRAEEARLAAEQRAEKNAERAQPARAGLWAAVFAVVQLALWLRDPDAALVCALVALVLLLAGVAIFGLARTDEIASYRARKRGCKQGFLFWGQTRVDPFGWDKCQVGVRTASLLLLIAGGAGGLLLIILQQCGEPAVGEPIALGSSGGGSTSVSEDFWLFSCDAAPVWGAAPLLPPSLVFLLFAAGVCAFLCIYCFALATSCDFCPCVNGGGHCLDDLFDDIYGND